VSFLRRFCSHGGSNHGLLVSFSYQITKFARTASLIFLSFPYSIYKFISFSGLFSGYISVMWFFSFYVLFVILFFIAAVCVKCFDILI